MNLNIPVQNNKNLDIVFQKVKNDERLNAFLEAGNIIAIDRLGYNDHGPTHVAIVANIALKLLRNLVKGGVVPSIVEDHHLRNEDAEVVVFLASIFHDIGHVVHREQHHMHSVTIAYDFLKDYLADIYTVDESARVTSEVLHAIVGHDNHCPALSVEAGVVRVADALDMKQGRARIPFDEGSVSIHAVSAMAIEDVEIRAGDKPVEIKITMSNSAGIFQIDELLKVKLRDSGLEEYFTITAEVTGEEKKILDKIDVT